MADLDLAALVAEHADPAVSAGVVRVDADGSTQEHAWGLADRRHGLPMTPQHRFAMASGCKGFTGLAMLALVADGTVTLDTTARSLLGDDLPLVADDVTIEHLLSHRSGIGEYFDDDADPAEYLLPVPVHALQTPSDYLPLMDGHPTAFKAGTDFAYNNGGFVLLSILVERASGRGFHELVRERVLAPAGMTRTDYLRSDSLPGDAAVGYVQVDGAWRTNVHHLPVIGGGDGGAYTTTEDMYRFWHALLDGRIVPRELVEEARRPRLEESESYAGYGLALWLPTGGVSLEGEDTGVSFRSVHLPERDFTWTVAGTTSDAAWPLAQALWAALGRRPAPG